MNYNETMDHLTNLIADREQCSRTKARQFIANALQMAHFQNAIIFVISHRTCCFPEIHHPE